jgi:hypothetical protein
MQKDHLFVLPPGFEANDRFEYCPECAEIWGLLNYYPGLMPSLEISFIGIDHPRIELTDVLGPGKHNAPTLILADGAPRTSDAEIKTANGHAYIDSARQIGVYFSERYGTARPRGT